MESLIPIPLCLTGEPACPDRSCRDACRVSTRARGWFHRQIALSLPARQPPSISPIAARPDLTHVDGTLLIPKANIYRSVVKFRTNYAEYFAERRKYEAVLLT